MKNKQKSMKNKTKANVFGYIAFLLMIAVVFNVVVLCVASASGSNYVAVIQSWQAIIRDWFINLCLNFFGGNYGIV